MKNHIFLFALLAVAPGWSFAQFDSLPDSPLDSSMGNAAGGTAATLNQLDKQGDEPTRNQQQREEEQADIDKYRYDEPTDHEFNRNYDPDATAPDME